MVELIAKRYGQALFELSNESGDLSKRGQEIELMVNAFNEDKDFLVILNHPKLSKKEKIQLIQEIFNGKVDDNLIGFLVLAIQKNRQESIVDILKYTLAKIEDFNGYVTAYVTSAIPLSDKETKLIKDKLEAQTGKKITLENHVDKSIIGGLFIRIKDRVVDNTIKTSLHRMGRDVYDAKV